MKTSFKRWLIIALLLALAFGALSADAADSAPEINARRDSQDRSKSTAAGVLGVRTWM